MSLEVGIVGLPRSGKTALFNALTHAHADAGYADRPHVGMASVPEDRLDEVARVVGSAKATPAGIRVLDVPGTGPAMLGNVRRADALLAVLDGFSPESDPESDLETLRLELLVADREHVEKRLETVRRQAKSGDPALRREVEELERVLAHLESERPLSEYEAELPRELEPLTAKPLVTIENGPHAIDAQFEAELAELGDAEAAEFRGGPSALDEVVRRLRDALGLITFFTANENEARAWTLRRGQTALEAAAAIHTDIAHGFVRCEVIRAGDLIESGSRSEAARRGLQRLEGKSYVVEDGDVLQIRFTPARS
jgi:ribosome-binding ATPase YchF (GTP1/OBG family)